MRLVKFGSFLYILSMTAFVMNVELILPKFKMYEIIHVFA